MGGASRRAEGELDEPRASACAGKRVLLEVRRRSYADVATQMQPRRCSHVDVGTYSSVHAPPLLGCALLEHYLAADPPSSPWQYVHERTDSEQAATEEKSTVSTAQLGRTDDTLCAPAVAATTSCATR